MPHQDAINHRVYHARGAYRSYRGRDLNAAEAEALRAFRSSFVGRRALDLGVGGGRTTRHLAPLTARYVGGDYSPVMVSYLRKEMPDIDVRHLDMRDLSSFADESFDCVFGFDNVLDAVSHDDRLRVLAEVRRVLGEEGTFIFSSHNLRYRFAASGPRLDASPNPLIQLRHLAKYALRMRNHLRVGRHRRWAADYALLDDTGHHYAALHYYIDQRTQAEQLRDHGFELLDAFARNGDRMDDTPSEETPDILYVARRQ
jgi:SAM-dependent methyltransferase